MDVQIPAHGHAKRFDRLAQGALISEARTMQMNKNGTNIPAPTVHAFDESFNNEVKVPFILMGKIDGIPLYKLWFER